jgi:hypothetical protein
MKRAWKKLALGSSLALALGVSGFEGYKQLVKAGVLRYNQYDRRERGELRMGSAAPDLTLQMYGGAPVKLSDLWATKPVFLVFGSCT